jgi:pimeloyl-ACP methyl ester carboxylesterase
MKDQQVAPDLPALSEATRRAVDVGGHRLALECAGRGRPTVVLEAGLATDRTTWEPIWPALAALTRVCRYDRAGLGESQPGPGPRTSAQIVTELHTLLVQAAVPGPYVLVGHSIGGLHLHLYASRYPGQVVGLVLLDWLHPATDAAIQALLPREQPDEAPALQLFRQQIRHEGVWAYGPEDFDWQTSLAQVQATPLPPTLGVTIVSVAGPVGHPELPLDLRRRIGQRLVELDAAMVQQAGNGVHRVVTNSGHNLHHDRPELVIEVIREMVDGVRRAAGGKAA